MKRIISTFYISLYLFSCVNALADSKLLKFDSEVHDFGQVLISNGPVNCSFTATNISSTPVVIQSVTTSCGCTSVKWDHNSIAPGAKTVIKATYTNDEGPYPFDKTLTVKLTGEQKPIILHLRGISQEKMKKDEELFTIVYAQALGLMTNEFKCGNIEQGRSRSDKTTVANFSSAPVKVSFLNITEGLDIEVVPNPIPAKGHAELRYTVTGITGKWGNNLYSAVPVINGKSAAKTITVKAFTAENFSSLTKEQRAKGSRPMFAESTFSFNHKKQGAKLTATFTCQNKGGSPLVIHRAESDFAGAVPGTFPSIVPGASGTFTVSLDTKALPKGEALITVTLTTNSPMRPIVNLFLTGWID